MASTIFSGSTPADRRRQTTAVRAARRKRVDVAVVLPLLAVELAWLALLCAIAFELVAR